MSVGAIGPLCPVPRTSQLRAWPTGAATRRNGRICRPSEAVVWRRSARVATREVCAIVVQVGQALFAPKLPERGSVTRSAGPTPVGLRCAGAARSTYAGGRSPDCPLWTNLDLPDHA